MDRREYKAWRRRLRDERRIKLQEIRSWNEIHGGSYNNDKDVSDSKYTNSTYFLRDNVNVTRHLKDGDFKTTTEYTKYHNTQKGLALLYYRWFYDKGATHTSGYGAKAQSSPTATWWGGWTDSSSMRSKLNTAAQSALLSRIVGNAPNWDVLTDLAESKETVGLLRSSAQWFMKVATAVKKRDVMTIARMFKVSTSKKGIKRLRRRIYPQRTLGGYGVTVGTSMSNLWMSYRYGFMPIIYSMQDALIAFNAEFSKGVKLTEQVTLSDSLYAETSGVGNTSTGYKATNRTSRTVQGSWRKKAYFNYTDSMLARLVSPAALLQTAWEVVPFSFVADWFVSVGDYLDNLQVDTITSGPVAVNVTEKGTSVLRNWFEPNGVVDGYRHTIEKFYGSVCTATSFTFARSKGSLSVPGIDISQSWYTFKRSIDVACLSWQRVHKRLNEYVEPDGFRYRVH